MKLAGIVLGFAGAVWLMLGNAQNGFGFEGSLGDLFILINAMSYGIYLVLVKPLMLRYSPLTVIRWVFTFGLLYVLPLGFSQFQEIEFEGFSQQIWLEVLFVIIFTTFLTYLLNVYALKKVSPTVVSFYIYLQPLHSFDGSHFNGTRRHYLGKGALNLAHICRSLPCWGRKALQSKKSLIFGYL